jgi:hypothetical protein
LKFQEVNIFLFAFYLSPLGALVEGGEKLVDGLSVHLDQRFAARARLVDLRQGRNGVGDDLKQY